MSKPKSKKNIIPLKISNNTNHLLVKSFSGFSVRPELPNALLKYHAKTNIKKGNHKINSNLYLAENNAKLLDDSIA